MCKYTLITGSQTKFCLPTSATYFVSLRRSPASLKINLVVIRSLLSGKRNLVEWFVNTLMFSPFHFGSFQQIGRR